MSKKNIIIIIVISLFLLVLGFILLKGGSNSKENGKENNGVERKGASEEDIVNAYNMSKDDAIEIVKRIYNGDIYEFSAEINKDSKYIVTVKNTITKSDTKYLVDPTKTNGSFYEVDE